MKITQNENKPLITRKCIIIIFMIIIFTLVLLVKRGLIKEKNFMAPDTEDLGEKEDLDNKDQAEDKGIIIVVDPGHGGRDPGKVGVNGILEKDINLSIALKLRSHLEDNGYRVIMTREDDSGLYNEGDSNKKVTDLKKRVDIVNNSGAILAISIHQNSFSDSSCKGAQVFYYGTSSESEIFANVIQEQIKITLQPDNKRLAKADTSYYMLKNTKCPIVIVECGFLTNHEEANMLTEEDYQEKMSHAIYLGLDTYIKLRD